MAKKTEIIGYRLIYADKFILQQLVKHTNDFSFWENYEEHPISFNNCISIVLEKATKFDSKKFLNDFFKRNPPIKFEKQHSDEVLIGLTMDELQKLIVSFLFSNKLNQFIEVDVKLKYRNLNTREIKPLREKKGGQLSNEDITTLDFDQNDCVILEIE